MPLSRLSSFAFFGIDALPVDVEVDVTPSDKLSLVIVGLPDTAVKESKDRVLTAMRNSHFSTGEVHCTVNLAPGDLKKEGPLYDLPIAIGLLSALNLITSSHYRDYLIVGELGLSGEVRGITGALPMALLAKKLGKKGVIVPSVNSREAAVVPEIDVIGVQSLKEAVDSLNDPKKLKPLPKEETHLLFSNLSASVDFSDIKGQLHAKRALEIAASGNHNLLLSGPPGSGKTMLAKALIGIMPELTMEEALETTKIYSASGLLPHGQPLVTSRPFRSPHHTISHVGMIGGGSTPKPGEVSLAHNGILFLDELPEFQRGTLEVLRQPMEDRMVTISRAQAKFSFPTRFLCIAAMNPCPCGYLGHPDKPCKDTEAQVTKYRSKISGPLLDRIDMQLEVPALRYQELSASYQQEHSKEVLKRVKAARDIQYKRLGNGKTNSQMSSKELKKHCELDAASREWMRQAIDIKGISIRAYDRILRVARTIADLVTSNTISEEHLLEALHFHH